MKKIVINACHGGFSLSREAMLRLRELGEPIALKYVMKGEKYPNEKVNEVDYCYPDIERDNPLLVQVLEELKEKADGLCSKLKIVEIPDDADWHIEEYDGYEHIAEKHRTWG